MTVKKLGLAVLVLLIGSVLLTSFTGCEKKKPPESKSAASVTMYLEQKDNKWQLSPEKVHKILIYKWEEYISKSENTTSVLDISDESGLKLFAGMINNAERINAILDVAAPPYVAEVYCKNRVAVLSLYIGHHKNGERYGGMYINECNTGQGYHITVEDANAFWDAYGHSLS